MLPRIVLFAILGLVFVSPTSAQVCTGGTIGFDFGPGNIDAARNCVNLFWCHDPEVAGVEYLVMPAGCDPTTESCTVRAIVPLQFPGNRNNSTSIGFFDSPIKLLWQDSGGGFAGACGNAGARIQVDQGDAWIQRSFACGDSGGGEVFSLQITVCDAVSGCERNATTNVDLTDSALAAAVCPGPPPEDGCTSCAGCFGVGGGGGPGSGGGGGGAPGAGGGGISGGPGTGPGAVLRYKAGSIGSASVPAPADWSLGRNWSHSYASRVLEDGGPLSGQALLFTPNAVFKTFIDTDLDGTYDQVSPADEYRTLEKTGSGFSLTDLDGTVESFDTAGRWLSRVDRNGNTATATYTGSELGSVAFPDGRREDFTYHPSGHLDTITEVGVDGITTRQWAYTWSGDDLARIDRPDGTAFGYLYNDPAHPGYLTRITLIGNDGTSERITAAWEYDAQGNVVKLWRGHEFFESGVDGWQFEFDNPVLPTATMVTDPFGSISTYTWAADRDSVNRKPKLIGIEGDCPTCGLGPNSQLLYEDPANPFRVTQETDGRGHITRFAYDSEGRQISQIEAFQTLLERETVWTWNPTYPALVETITWPSTAGFPNEKVTTFGYDAAGNQISRTAEGFEDDAPFTFITEMVPNAGGRVTSVDPPGFGSADATTFTYDPTRGNGFLIQEGRTDPLIGTTTFGYDAFNRRSSITDVNGVITETEYDSLDRVRFVRQRGEIAAEDLVTENRYNPFGDLFQIVRPEGNVIEYTYDAAGRLESVERKADDLPSSHGERVFYTLDNIGNRVLEQHQRWDGTAWETRAQTAFEYATRCFLDKTIQGFNGEEVTTEYAYDCDGNLEHTWDANHPSTGQTAPATTTYVYDELDRVAEVRQPFGGTVGGTVVTAYDYDVQDQLTSATDGEGTVTAYVYSDRGLLTTEISEVSGTTENSYNEHGQLETRTDARGITLTRTLDALDRDTFVDYPGESLDITNIFDDPRIPFSTGRLTRIERDGHGIDYAYDRFGRLTQDGILAYAYDGNGNQREMVYPGGVIATYTYDFADRQASLDLETPLGMPNLVSGATYEPSGPLNFLSLGNGLEETRTYDTRYFPNSIQLAGAAPLLDWQYSTDGMGNITGIADLLTPANQRTYGYQDVQYFLTQGDGPWGTRSWTYDSIGNRLSETRDGVIDTYSYLPNAGGGRTPKLDQISLGGGGSQGFVYDLAGNQTDTDTAGDLTTRTYDDASRLTTQGRGLVNASSEFLYDGRGFLRQSTGRLPDTSGGAVFCDGFESGDTSSWGGGGASTCFVESQTEPLYDSQGRLHGIVGASSVLVLYFNGIPVAQVEIDTGSVQYLTADHLGTLIASTSEMGLVSWEGGFEPFGTDFSGASANGIFLRFPGQWVDETWAQSTASEGHYNVNRWYEAGTTRYTRPDPLTSSPNLFAYVDSRPLRLVDPLGLLSLDPESCGPPGGDGAAGSSGICCYDDLEKAVQQYNEFFAPGWRQRKPDCWNAIAKASGFEKPLGSIGGILSPLSCMVAGHRGETMGCRSDGPGCGLTKRRTGETTFGPKSCDKGECGSLLNTVFHERLHRCGAPAEFGGLITIADDITRLCVGP